MSVRLPKYLHREIKKLAEEEGISMNQFIATAAAEKVSSLKTVAYLEKRAERGSEPHLPILRADSPNAAQRRPRPAWYFRFPGPFFPLEVGQRNSERKAGVPRDAKYSRRGLQP